MKTKLRFAPSPTGLIHLGNTRTALLNALYALKEKGIFLLRIEDTDKVRSTEEFATQLQNDLTWLNLRWQEGPQAGGLDGPYFQSNRQHVYDAYYQMLEEKGMAYPCFCSEAQLAIARKVQLASGQPPRYAGTCRQLTAAEIAEKKAQGLAPVLRFRIPVNQLIEFNDFVKGPQRFNSNDIGDFIIRRADGTSSFMFCNAIDDALMHVTHVMRGEDHLTNTPRQIMILNALHLPAPQYGHLSLIVGNDNSPLSKRHGSRNIYELREEGFIPIGVLNFLARLGHSYENNGLMPLNELAENFKVERLSRSPARFDADQLLYWQKEAVAACDAETLWKWMGIEVHSIVPADRKENFIDAIRSNVIFPKDALRWAQLFFDEKLHYSDEHLTILRAAGAEFYKQAIIAVENQGPDFNGISAHLKQTLGVKGKDLFQPFRIALSAEAHGPEMSKLTTLLGTELLVKRFNDVLRSL